MAAVAAALLPVLERVALVDWAVVLTLKLIKEPTV
jgi:hypothetical protein